jgi:hypothetical protein
MKALTVLTILTLALVGVCTPAYAQNRLFIYSVKFLCGLQTTAPSSPPSEPPVKPGNYATAINIHNFHPTATVEFRKKAVVANPEREPRGPISPFKVDSLGPNQALEVDCTDIVGLFPPPTATNGGLSLPSFVKGFVEIVSPRQLNVVGVYTAQTCTTTTPGQSCTPQGGLALEVVPQRSFFVTPLPRGVEDEED